MYVKLLTCLTLLFFLTLSTPSLASYKIVLKNGKTLEAESYAIKGDKITLKYKVGEASFRRGMVRSIVNQSGEVLFLSKPGKKLHKPAGSAISKPGKPSNPNPPGTSNHSTVDTRKHKEPTHPTDPDFYKGAWPQEREFMKDK